LQADSGNVRPVRLLAGSILCLAAAARVSAAGPDEGLPAHVIETIQVSASRLPESRSMVSQSPILLPSTGTSPPRTMADLMGSTPSVHADHGGGPGGFSALYLRGADPSHTVIMVDGVKINDPTNARGGGIDLSSIDPRTVARVEILPGASSAIYGADAMAGAINIVTQHGERTGLRIGTGIGEGGYRNAFAAGALVSADLGVQAQAAATHDSHLASSARLRTSSARLRAGNPAGRQATAWIRVQEAELAAFPEDSGGPLFAAGRTLERRDTRGVVAALNGETPVPWGTLKAYTSVFNQDVDIDSPGVEGGLRDPAGVPSSRSRSEYRRSTTGVTTTFGAAGNITGLLGVQYEHEDGEVNGALLLPGFALPTGFSLERSTRAVFAEARLALGSRWSAQAGARADDSNADGTRRTFRSALAYRPSSDGPVIAASLGTGYKPPSFFALGHPVVGNPDLKPETSRTMELSIGTPADEETRARIGYRAAVFRSRYADLVDFDPGPPPRLVNRSEVRIDGLEVNGTSRLTERFDLRAGLTLLSIRTPPQAPPLRNRPRMRASVAATYAMADGLTAAVAGSWIGQTHDSSVPTGSVRLSRYLLLDASIAYDLPRVRVTLAVGNLLDRQYQQFVGFPGPGRRVRVELTTAL
jgi:vitamin B12 transporter